MPEISNISIHISENSGDVSAIVVSPENPVALLVLAHGAGAGIHHAFMEKLAVDLADLSILTLRFNFPYMEKGKRVPDPPARAEKTVAKVLTYAQQQFPDLPVFAGGKSFGGRMTSQLLAKNPVAFVKGVVFFGFPLHAMGKPSRDRGDHLKKVKIPMLFLQGSKDKLATMELVKELCDEITLSTLHVFEGADHSFKVTRQYDPPDLASVAAGWVKKML